MIFEAHSTSPCCGRHCPTCLVGGSSLFFSPGADSLDGKKAEAICSQMANHCDLAHAVAISATGDGVTQVTHFPCGHQAPWYEKLHLGGSLKERGHQQTVDFNDPSTKALDRDG